SPVPAVAQDQKIADLLRLRRSSGFAGGEDIKPPRRQKIRQPRDLGRLARAFAAFKRYKDAHFFCDISNCALAIRPEKSPRRSTSAAVTSGISMVCIRGISTFRVPTCVPLASGASNGPLY